MKFLIDENIPRRIARFLHEHYPGSISAAEDSRFQGRGDDVLYKYLRGRSFVLVSFDSDFSNILRFPPSGTNGIIVVRPKGMNVTATTEKLSAFLSSLTSGLPKGSLTIITKKTVRTKLLK